MPMYRTPTTEELEDHFFGSGAFQYGWFGTTSSHFPALVTEYDEEGKEIADYWITEPSFIEGIKKYAEQHPTEYFDNLIDDMDANDVDNVIQLIVFGEIRYA